MAMPTTDCLSAVEMSNLVRRPLPDSEADKLACHLEQCTTCARQAEAILNGDRMEAAMRETAGALDATQMPDARELVERLKKVIVSGAFGQHAREAAAASPNDGTQCWASDDAVESLHFLRPPQQPDELGRLGQYRLLKKLGAGGMGMVFLAEDALLHRKVALKLMLPQFVAKSGAKERFLREARAAASIEHDHIVPIFQVGEDNGTPFLAMQFLKGEPLDACLAREGRLPVAEALRIARGMAEGLAAAHANNLIHRDIKPSNVWLESRTDATKTNPQAPTRVRLLDFGLARTVDDTAHLTQAGLIVGTPAFLAPEQARGERVDGRADLFSLGCVLYLMLTGEQPFKGKNTLSLLTALAVETPEAPTILNFDIPTEVSDLTMRLLAKSPGGRPESAVAVVNAIEALQEGKGSPVRQETNQPATRPASAGRRRRPRAWLAVGVLGGLLALAAGVVFYVVTDNGTVEVQTADPAVAVVFEQNGRVIKINDPTGKQTHVFDTGKWSVRLEGGPDGLEIELPKEQSFDLKRGGKQVVSVRRIAKLPERVSGAPVGKTLPTDAKSKYALAFDQKENVWVPSLKLDIARPLTLEGYVTVMTARIRKPFLCTFDGIYLSAGKTWTVIHDNHAKGGSIESAIPVQLGKRTHVAAVFTGRRVILFVDGEVAVSQDYKPVSQSGSFHIGGDGSGGTATGLMEEVRVSATARYDKTFTPAARFEPDADTLALYHFDEGTGEVLKDASGSGHHGKINGARWVKTSADWATQTAALPPELQAYAVGARLMERNSGFDGTMKHKIDDGAVTELEFLTDYVADISPVRALTGLKVLSCRGTGPTKGKLRDLRPLNGMKLISLDCTANPVTDLSPLKDVPLTYLNIHYTPVTDLSPLREMPLTNLNCGGTKVSDLSPLKNLTLWTLVLGNNRNLKDLSPLKGMKISNLGCNLTSVTDLSPIKDVPLKSIDCDFEVERDGKILRAIPTLEKINGKPAKEVLK